MAPFAGPPRSRFNAACPPSPAADIPNGPTAGTSITAMFRQGRLQGVGNPFDTDHGNGVADSIPAVTPLECTNCTTATFDQARAHFERAWRVFLSNRTKADLQASKTRAPTSPDFQSQISTHRSCGNQNGRRHSRLRPTGLNIN